MAVFLCFSYQSTLFAQNSESPTKGSVASAFQPSKPSVGTVIDLRKPRENWLPEDIDNAIPPVASGVACSLPTILQGAAQRVVELVNNVDRFTATEVLMHQDVNRSGHVGRPVTVKYKYLVSIKEARDGFLGVEELRNRGQSLASFPSHIATTGTPSLVLIFHPRYIGDFRTQCEGLGEWHGQPAWQLRFEQRADRSSRICSFVLNGSAHDVNLRGRAWILADSFQVARLETDLRESIPSIQLNLGNNILD
jgi:hypothetical protein